MRKFVISTVVLLLSLTSSAGYADGLFHRLPEDGASVSYKMEMTIVHGGESKAGNGTLRVSSVGQTTVDDEKCRWIEFKMEMKLDGREQTIIAKVLIPEKHLGNGKTPIDHVKKCWLKEGDREVREVEDVKGNMGGPMPVFLAGPLKDVKKLKPEVIESKLGKLSCEGATGRLEFKQGNTDVVAELAKPQRDRTGASQAQPPATRRVAWIYRRNPVHYASFTSPSKRPKFRADHPITLVAGRPATMPIVPHAKPIFPPLATKHSPNPGSTPLGRHRRVVQVLETPQPIRA